MKILFVTPTYFDEESIVGGGERYVTDFAEAFSKYVEVHIVSFGTQKRTFERNGIHYHVFKYRTFKHFTKTNPFCLGHIQLIKKGGWDLIHVHQLCTFVSDVACLAAHRSGIPVTGTDHGGGGAWVLNTRFHVYPKYAKVIGQSKQATQILDHNFEGRTCTIPGGINLEKYLPTNQRSEKNTILFVGRLLPHKGVHTLIKAFGKLTHTDYELVLLGRPGSSSYFEEIQTLAKGLNVKFETQADDNKLLEYYQSSTVTVLPSEQDINGNLPPELMGFTSMESQACGTPVIVSDAGPMNEFINENVTGLVFENANPESLAQAIEEVISWKQDESRSTHTQCRTFVNQFSWDSISKKHLELYQNLIKSNGGIEQ